MPRGLEATAYDTDTDRSDESEANYRRLGLTNENPAVVSDFYGTPILTVRTGWGRGLQASGVRDILRDQCAIHDYLYSRAEKPWGYGQLSRAQIVAIADEIDRWRKGDTI